MALNKYVNPIYYIPEPGRYGATKYQPALERYRAEFEGAKKYIQQGIDMATEGIAPEFQTLLETYAKSGDYEAGLRAIAEQEAKKGLGKTMGRLTAVGGTSGAVAAAEERGYTRELQTAYTGIEGQRIINYTRALELVGAAKEARAGRATTAYLSAGELLARYKEPTPTEYYDPNYAAYVGAVSNVIAASYGAAGRVASAAQPQEPSIFSPSYQTATAKTGGLSKEQLYQYDIYGVLPSGYKAA